MSAAVVTDPVPEVRGTRPVRDGLRVVASHVRFARATFVAAVVGSFLYGTGTAASGWVLGRLTDRVLQPAFAAGSISGRDLLLVGLALSAVALATSLGVWARRVCAGRTMFALQALHRTAVVRSYLRLPMAWHQRHPAGRLLSVANADVEGIWQVMAPLPMSLGVAVMLVVAAAAMVAADPVLAAVGLTAIPAVVALNAVYQRRMTPLVTTAQELRAEVSGVAHESFDGALVVKVAGIEDAETARFAAVADRLRGANVAVGTVRGVFDPLIEGLPTLATLLVLLLGTARVGSGAAAPGDVVQVAYLLTVVAFPVRSLGWVLAELPRTIVCWNRVREVLEAPVEVDEGTRDLPAGEGPVPVRAHGVRHVYTDPLGRPVPALNGATLDVPAGTTIAVVGPTGSGKSTLAGMLVRLVDPSSGEVLLDGVDLVALRRGALTDAACLVAQSAFVFDDTVRANVTLGEDRLDDAQVRAALETAQAWDFVAALPAGLDTRVGERGATLSGGQRQRIALARALVRRPRLLVLDDATSAVDPAVEADILAGLRATAGPGGPASTTVVVAYRQATIALADAVAWVEGGTVAAVGGHDELLASVPGYAELVHAYARQEARAGQGRA
ncbi:MAG: ABC transporter ATP-binding protein [Kineosporiaceae bacterium]